jgi:hypothetical protein
LYLRKDIFEPFLTAGTNKQQMCENAKNWYVNVNYGGFGQKCERKWE